MEIEVNKIVKEILGDEKFLNKLVYEMTIATLEFDLNWKHQIIDSPIKAKPKSI